VRGVRSRPAGEALRSGIRGDLASRIDRLRGRCAEIGWQLDFLTRMATAELMPTLAKLNTRFQRRSLRHVFARTA